MTEKNVAFVYYSRTDNTKTAVECLTQKMEDKNLKVDLIRIMAEIRPSFFQALSIARNQTPVPIKHIDFDPSSYNIILLGMPCWAYHPAPFYKSFLQQIKGYEKIPFALFLCAGVSLSRNQITLERFRSEMKTLNIPSIVADLILIVRKKEIKDGQSDIGPFIEHLLK